VYDAAAGDWYTPAGLVEQVALELADDLNERLAAGHHVDQVRYVAPTPVQYVAGWTPGRLDAWIWDTNSSPPQWLGRTYDADGRPHWFPAAELRPAD
jgi:hypothetical protein